MSGVEEADDDAWSILPCNSGIVFTARMSEASAGDGDVSIDEDTVGMDKVLLLAEVVMDGPVSGVVMAVAGEEADDGRTRALIFS